MVYSGGLELFRLNCSLDSVCACVCARARACMRVFLQVYSWMVRTCQHPTADFPWKAMVLKHWDYNGKIDSFYCVTGCIGVGVCVHMCACMRVYVCACVCVMKIIIMIIN